MSTRHVIATVHPHPEWPELTQLYRTVDLPDAEHVHLTRQPDGTYTAVPMRQVGAVRTYHNGEMTHEQTRWVDADERAG